MTVERRITLPSKLREIVVVDSPAKVGPPPVVRTPSAALVSAASDTAERQHIESILNSLRETVNGLRSREAEYLHAMQRLTMELSVAIASRLLHEQIETGSFPIETLVREVAQRLEA